MTQQYQPRHTDPIKDLALQFRRMTDEQINRTPGNLTGTVIQSTEPMMVKFDGLDVNVSYEDGFFVVSDHLSLKVGERFVAIPLVNGQLYLIIARFTIDVPIIEAVLIDNHGGVPVGFKVNVSADKTTRYPTIIATTWATIRGRVGATLRTLTHLGHYHTFSPTTVETSSAAPDDHTHTVTLPNTHTATNPE